MAFKLMIFAAWVAVARAGLIAAPAVAAVRAVDDYDPNPQYSYAYDVRDALTGDNKSQQESRSGDVVQGQYSLVESDGTRRIVDYTADPVNGFNAIVRKEGLHGVVAPVVAGPAVVAARVAAPVAVAHPAPLTYAAHPAPLTYAAHPAPLTYAAHAAPLAYATRAAPLTYAAHPAPFAPLARFAAPIAHTSFGLAHPAVAPVARIGTPYATYVH